MSVLCSVKEVLFSFFFCICWVERSFFSLTAFGGNLLAVDVHSSVTMDRHVQAWQLIGSNFLLNWGLLWASACSLEAWARYSRFLTTEKNLGSLLLRIFAKIGNGFQPSTIFMKKLQALNKPLLRHSIDGIHFPVLKYCSVLIAEYWQHGILTHYNCLIFHTSKKM